MSEKTRVLVCGDVKGNFKALFNKSEAINKKSGPFDILLCVGSFFGENNVELEAYKNGGRTVAIPTYILGPSDSELCSLYPDSEGAELCPNITYLGKRGVYSTSSGIKIAYLSGNQGDPKTLTPDTFNGSDCLAVRDACLRGQPDYRGVDILITGQWPGGVTNHDEKKLNMTVPEGSLLVSWLAMHLRPRYHFVASPQLYYERPPYRNMDKNKTSRELATRFIAVSSVNNKDKEKWVYACSLQPTHRMRMMDLLQATTDETPCPYPDELLQQNTPGIAEKYKGNGQFFYDLDAQDNRGNKRKHRGDHKDRKRPEFDQASCWFCLSSPTVEKHLVISVGDSCYLALAKGPLVPLHCLILPVTHHQSTSQAPDEVNEEIKRFKSALMRFFDSIDQLSVFYERNFKTSHLQIQCIPVPKQTESQLMEVFQDEAAIQGIQLERIPAHSDLKQVTTPGSPYFHLELPSGEQMFAKTRHNFPLQFGRDVLASSPILDCEDRADWRACALSKDEEIEYVHNFRRKFKQFDFTVDEDDDSDED